MTFGCGDDEAVVDGGPDSADAGADAGACVDPADVEPAAGRLASPADIDRTGCETGTLAGFDPTGLWYIEQDPHPRFGRGPVRFELTCSEGLTVGQGTIVGQQQVEHRLLDADDLFWREVTQFGENFFQIEAYDVCRRDTDGSLFGRHAVCYVGDFGEECFEPREFVARPFGRIAGEADADGLALVSEHTGGATPWPAAFTADVRVRGGVAYVARGTDGVRIVDVSDPAVPADLGYFAAESDNFNELKVVEDAGGSPYLLVASAAAGVYVVDVSDPAAPAQVARIAPNGEPDHGIHTLYTETIDATTYAYLADGFTDQLFVYDVTDPVNPVDVGTYTIGNEDYGIHAVFAVDGRAYIQATVGGMIVVDLLPDPSAGAVVGQYQKPDLYAHQAWVTTTTGGRTVAAYGDEGYGAHLEIIDVDETSGEFMTRIGEIALRDQVSIHDVMALGDRVYVAHYQDGLRIFDISDPTAPAQAAHFNTWDPATAPGAIFEGASGLDIDVDSGLIYLTDSPRGLLILEESR